jgi:hypothetical protein
MKLKLEHLAPYLPHDLIGKFRRRNETLKSCTKVFINREILYGDFKPILRPLSDLTEDIEIDGEKFIPLIFLANINGCFDDDIDRLYINIFSNVKFTNYDVLYNTGGDEDDYIMGISTHNIEISQYNVMQQLFKWHFDVFGLIEKGLAIDINTL